MDDQLSAGSAPLRDGRRLGYLAVGPREGLLVLYLHGAIGSPQEAGTELRAVTRDLGIRYVMVSRPGFGDSGRVPGRALLDFAADAAALAEGLGHERFAVVGVSAGGPYALACAHELPARVAVTAVVSCMAQGACRSAGLTPLGRAALRIVRQRPQACERAGDAVLGVARRRPRLVARVMRSGAAPADRRLLAEFDAGERAAARFLAAAGGGIGGMIDDHLVCARPWGFDPQGVHGLVHVWHGLQDRLVPADAAVLLAAALPHARLALDPDEGHFFYRRRLREILGDLTVAAASSARARPRA